MEELQSSRLSGGDDDEFYEKIEAPKFVDFTDPDLSLPDDRSWFCLRVGCEQKHEEEMDPEALYRKFVLRVMAARSPNLRLQRALSRKVSSTTIKCPQSAPAKSSKPRISKLAEITAVSQKVADAKVRVHHLRKLKPVTPTTKGKKSSVAGKALTTPKHKRCPPKPDPFRSVRSSKATLAVPNTRVVAKALVFHTPKKAKRTKAMSGYPTSVTEICAEMKTLDIKSQREDILGSSCKSSRGVRCKPEKSVPVDPSRRQLSYSKNKTRTKVPFLSRDCKDQEAKISKCLKGKRRGYLEKFRGPVPQERGDNDSSDMEIDGKSRDGSLKACYLSDSCRNNGGNEHEEGLSSEETTGKLGSDEGLEGKAFLKFQTSEGEGDESTEQNEHEESNGSNSKEGNISEKDNLLSHQTTACPPGSETKATDSDDKENALASDGNRELNSNKDQSVRKIHSRNGTHEAQEVTTAGCKTFKETAVCTPTGAQGAKLRKLKPTNPKPFRLRTDERGILKEANLERRQQLDATVKEAEAISNFAKGNPQTRHRNKNHNEKQHGRQCRQDNDSHEGNKMELDKRTLEERMMKPSYLKTTKCKAHQRNATTPQRNFSSKRQISNIVTVQLEDGKDKGGRKIVSSLKKARSPLMRQKLVSPRSAASARKATISLASPNQLNEKSSRISKQPGPCSNNAASASRCPSRGRRPITIPKEPCFHSVHVPKTCTKKSA